MNTAIWKYDVTPDRERVLSMPTGAEILCVQSQHDRPQLWAAVDPSRAVEDRRIVVRRTGHSLTGDEGRYLGTAQMMDGGLVFHYFEAKP